MSWGPKVWVLVLIQLSITKSWLWVSSERFAEPIKIENIAIFQNGGRPPPRIVGNAQTASDVPNHGFLLRFSRIKQICDTWCLNFFLCWCWCKIRHFFSHRKCKIPFFDSKYWIFKQNLKCCQRPQKAPKVLEKASFSHLQTYKTRSFTVPTQKLHFWSSHFEAKYCC